MNKKTLFVTSRGLLRMEDNEPVGVNSDREGVSTVLRITEPTHIVYNRNNKRIELDGEEGDILIVFYDNTFPNPMILVHSAEWAENLIKYDEEQQRIKEKWANAAANGDAVCADSAC